MWKPATALRVPRHDRELLGFLSRAPKTPQRVALRARIVLGAAAGRSINGLARELEVTRPPVLLWRRRYHEAGIGGLLQDAPRPGRKKAISAKKVETLVNATLHTTPNDATHWSTRAMARAHGVSEATVRRIWSAHGLHPHRVKTFKLSRDPEFVKKLRDGVGLYLNPPAKALVLCVDEKSQIQALDRTQPALPMRAGYAETRTHDYVRHGTTTLFAALNVLEGTVIGSCKPRHRHQEFLEFMNEVDRKVPRRREVHLILDNYGTHTHPRVNEWFAAHPATIGTSSRPVHPGSISSNAGSRTSRANRFAGAPTAVSTNSFEPSCAISVSTTTTRGRSCGPPRQPRSCARSVIVKKRETQHTSAVYPNKKRPSSHRMMASRVSSVLRSGSSSVRRRRNDADGANDDGDVENLGVRHGTIESWEYYNGWTTSSQIYHYYHYITRIDGP